jgi:hypothetical protein
MKRNETPLNASNFLDALCSPFALTGNYALLVQSHPWLRKNVSGNAKTSALFNQFLPAPQSLPGYDNMIEKFVTPGICEHVKPIE